jgi:hypothetical protein
MTAPDNKAASFRDVVDQCRRLAAEAVDPVEKQELLDIADEWQAHPLSSEALLALKQLAILQ